MFICTYSGEKWEAGCDEAGRGCLAGPVVASAVIINAGMPHLLIRDSKSLSESQRDQCALWIKSNALAWAVGISGPDEIDRYNILQASFLAMNKAVARLKHRAEHLLIDGNGFNNTTGIPHSCIIKGDQKVFCISAASILAKTYRDQLMREIDIKYPQYNWKQNKGYPTKEHRRAIEEFGPSPYHRKSFKVKPTEQLKMFE